VQAADGLGEDCPTADAAATVVASAVQTGGAAMIEYAVEGHDNHRARA
jgi:ApbE superfamily uncharacterized protein (UPF0280 family)